MTGSPEIFPQRGEVAALIRSKDWSGGSLGHPDSWPSSLRSVLRLMLTSRYAMWLGWGPELAFFYNDAYAEQTLGKKHPWALGRSAREVWAEIWDQIGPRIDRVLAGGESTWDEGLLLFLERNGYPEETYHTFSYSPAFDDAGAVAGLFCVVTEETERVIGERRLSLLRELAASLGRAQTTGEVLAAMEQCLTEDGRVLPFTLTYLFADDGSAATLASRTSIEAAHPAAPAVIALRDALSPWPLAQVLDEARPVEMRLDDARAWPCGGWSKAATTAFVVPIMQAGQARPAGAFVAGLNPHRPLDGSYRSFIELFVGQLAAGLDNARAYDAERRRAEALAEIDRAKTAFFSNVSHELRTPLTLMLGPTEDALASAERSLSGESLEIVHRNELRLLKLVNTLLDFSRLEAGRARARFVATDLAELTTDLASAFRSAMERGGLRYEVDCSAVTQPVYVDHDMWEKIVLNLLSNALKFTLEGSVHVTLREREGEVVLEVRDTGPGIAPAELPRMFERFHRIEGTPARTQEGSGIGLALVKDLVELHGGRIDVKSDVGHGTTFTVSVPTGHAHLPADDLSAPPGVERARTRADAFVTEALRWLPPHDALTEPPAGAGGGGGGEVQREHILVADDNADMRDYVTRLLRQHWSVEAVADGAAALEAIHRREPDLVLSDVMMPRVDGFELVRRLREDPARRTIPIVLLSARAGEEATGEGLRSGANDYLIKPFSARELVARISSQLAIAKIRREAEAEKEAQRRVVESLFANAPAGITLLRGEEKIIELANAMALRLWGKRADVVGRPLLEALPELRGQGYDELIDTVRRTGEPYVGEESPFTFRREGREERVYLELVYAPAQNERGETDGVAAFGFDVTAQVVAREGATLGARVGRALASREDLGTQLRQCCEALAGAGPAFARIWTYNEAHRELELRAAAGTPRAGAGGEGGDGAAALLRVPLGTSALGRIAQSNEPFRSTAGARAATEPDPDAAVREGWPAFSAYPLRVQDRLIGLMALYGEHPPADALDRALATVADMIALGIDRDHSERFRELFIGMLGHDLRNPLNAVNVGTHILLDAPGLPVTQRRTVERVRSSAGRMSRMIDQVLDFTRARSGGGIPVDRAADDIHAICAQAVDELLAAHPERVVDTQYRGDGRGLWDADRLTQLFSNVVGNALAYGAKDAPVRVVLDASDDVVRCTVHNLGAPIPRELLPTLFDPFRRATHAKSSRTQGLGLGLFIAQQIAVAHGGEIAVRSSEAEGTELTVRLPRERSET